MWEPKDYDSIRLHYSGPYSKDTPPHAYRHHLNALTARYHLGIGSSEIVKSIIGFKSNNPANPNPHPDPYPDHHPNPDSHPNLARHADPAQPMKHLISPDPWNVERKLVNATISCLSILNYSYSYGTVFHSKRNWCILNLLDCVDIGSLPPTICRKSRHKST